MNAYILQRTMNDFEQLKSELRFHSFEFQDDADGSGDIRVQVDYNRVDEFSLILRKHLNAPYNYVDAKFPEKKLSVLIFLDKTWMVDNLKTDREAKEWALSIGLSKSETDWSTFY